MSTPLEFPVTFTPGNRRVDVLPGTLLLEACARADIILQTPCGGAGACGKCRVRVIEGETEAPRNPHLSEADSRDGWRLACVSRVKGPLQIEIPAESRFAYSQRILTDHQAAVMDIEPSITVEDLSLMPPSREDDMADLERLETACGGPLNIPPFLLARLPARLREANWQVQLVREHDALLDVLPASPDMRPLGLAFDLGSTTVVGTLLDLDSGEELGVASGLNRQIRFGDDVLSRIQFASRSPENLNLLQRLTVETLNVLIDELCHEPDRRARIYRVYLAGNSTMQQLCCGIDPGPLGAMPFVAAFSRPLTRSAGDLGLRIPAASPVTLFPQPGGFVGGDTVAGMLAAGFDRLDKPTLLIDIGTNGEIALRHPRGIPCASTAAGPAFEGARIRQGMRADTGAIEKVICRNGDLEINVIGNVAPIGLCGTALIDATAELLRLGMLDPTGRIPSPEELPAALSDTLRERVEPDGDAFRVRLSPPEGPSASPGIYLCQRDIRELQLASGAIRAGVETLLACAKLTPDSLDCVLIAGAFGNFIRRNNAQRIGLLPPLPHHRIRYIGNAASMGAKMALLAKTDALRCEQIQRLCRHVDLGANPDFQMAFGMAMLFPET